MGILLQLVGYATYLSHLVVIVSYISVKWAHCHCCCCYE